MKTTRHILVILALLIAGVSPLWADDAELGGLHCGDIVVITATPADGSKFVQWSDGNTDNPREIEIGEDGNIDVYAIFQEDCAPKQLIKLVQLYNKLMMVDVKALQQQNYNPLQSDIGWYRIVGEPDKISATADDELFATGYYIDQRNLPDGTYYAQIWLNDGDDFNCADVLRSTSFTISHTGLDTPEDNAPPIRKVIYNEHLFILLKERIYDARGQLRSGESRM